MIATHILSDIDQICDHVGVMHEGRMIYSGSMREMKQRLRCDDFRLELDGSIEEIEQLAAAATALEGVEAYVRDLHILVVQVGQRQGRASAMAEVLKLIDSSDVLLQTIGSGQNETEYAYLQLLQEDTAHGFRRFELANRSLADANAGDSGA